LAVELGQIERGVNSFSDQLTGEPNPASGKDVILRYSDSCSDDVILRLVLKWRHPLLPLQRLNRG